jgi:hypothetical protein
MEVIFLKSGESPNIGSFEVGDERKISASIAMTFIERGLCKAKSKAAQKTVEPKKGVKGHGG